LKITIIGSGYVGLVTGACLAELGNNVFCLDVDQKKIDTLNAGGVPIHEPGLREIIARNVATGRLSFSTDVQASVAWGDIQFIAVGTPPHEDGSADLQHVLAAARNIGRYMHGFKVVVDKSTVPVGTADMVAAVIREELALRLVDQADFSVVSNPEFLKEGAAIEDFMRPDRIVLGVADDALGKRALAAMQQLYAPFIRNHDRMLTMDVKSAELTKYAANAMLATRISFMNELANVAEKLGADIESVRLGIGSDSRIGYHFLYPGCGYGGSCFPKDVKALIKTAQDDAGVTLKVLAAVEDANNSQKHILSKKIKEKFGTNLIGMHFAVWGLAFKPNTDDMREAPSVELIYDLLNAGATVTAYDPVAMGEARRILGNLPQLTYASDAMAALVNADALVVVTEWKEFRSPDFQAIKIALNSPIVFDGRNLFDPTFVRTLGFDYLAIGR
jgi:UDPglucose 6-dehydrogenase